MSRQKDFCRNRKLWEVCRARALSSIVHSTAHLSRARPRALVCARCTVLSRHNFYVATQGLPALTTPCRDTGHGRGTGSKGLCRDRENLCHDPSHPVPTLNPIATRGQVISIATENSLLRQMGYGQSVATGIFYRNRPFASSCPRAHGILVAHVRVVRTTACLSLALVSAAAPLCRNTGDPV